MIQSSFILNIICYDLFPKSRSQVKNINLKKLTYMYYYAGEIWNRRFRSENASNIFRPPDAEEIWKRN